MYSMAKFWEDLDPCPLVEAYLALVTNDHLSCIFFQQES